MLPSIKNGQKLQTKKIDAESLSKLAILTERGGALLERVKVVGIDNEEGQGDR